jgi:hypothetical protein
LHAPPSHEGDPPVPELDPELDVVDPDDVPLPPAPPALVELDPPAPPEVLALLHVVAARLDIARASRIPREENGREAQGSRMAAPWRPDGQRTH